MLRASADGDRSRHNDSRGGGIYMRDCTEWAAFYQWHASA